MKKADLDYFKAMLLASLEDLARQDDLGSEAQKTVQLDQQSVGRLSRMDALQGQAMARATAQRRDVQIRKIKGALKRIEEDEFGYCADCGEDLPKARLELDPSVVLCVSCAMG